MRPILKGLTAGVAVLGVAMAAPTAAQAFVPLVAGAIAGGAILGGSALGAATTYPYHYGYGYRAYGPAYAYGPEVIGGCYYTHAWRHGMWRRVRVCD